MKIRKVFFIIVAFFALTTILTALLLIKERPDFRVASDLSDSKEPISAQYTESSFFLSAIKQNKTAPSLDTVSGLIVPHHLLAKDMIASAYAYASSGKHSTIVLLSPDHFSAGKSEVSVSERDFATVFGIVASDKKIAGELKKLPFVGEGDFFYREHGLQAELPFIKYYFPNAKIIALTFKPTTSQDKLDQIISVLEKNLPDDSLIIQSTDFSHYLSPAQAAREDTESIAMIMSGDAPQSLDLGQPANLDSSAALYIQTRLQTEFFKTEPNILEHKNSQDYTTEPVDSSTSYLTVAYKAETQMTGAAMTGAATTTDENLSPDKKYGNAEFIFVGDIMLSRYIGELMAKRQDFNFPYEKIKTDLAGADLLFGNLEAPVSTRGESAGAPYPFRADPLVLSGLKDSGFSVLSVANNHAFDYKLAAFSDTLNNLKNADLDYTGGGFNFSEARAGALMEINGIKTTLLAYTDLVPKSQAATDNRAGLSYLDEAQMVKDIKAAKAKSDLVIVSFHWGQEYQTHSNQHQQKIAAEAVAAGADLIVGHHPHVPQEISEINGVTVAYSLGNFVFDQNFSPETRSGLILYVKIENKKIISVEPETIKFTNNYQPYITQK
ncbi:MAG: AmmeMemoRadiSam system protein B [Patescibacteria group bacterium]